MSMREPLPPLTVRLGKPVTMAPRSSRISTSACAGMVTGFALNVYLWLFTNVAFTWYVALGSGMTFIVGLAASFLLGGGSDAGLRAGLRQSGEA